MLVLLHLDLEGIIEVETDPKGVFVSFKVSSSNDRVLCVYTPSEYIALGDSWLGGVLLKDYKIILGDFHCAMDKMDRAVENEI